MRRDIFACLALTAVLAGGPALATTLVTFEVNSNAWNIVRYAPFGLPSQPSLSGNFAYDPRPFARAPILQINYVTGSRTWSAADLDPRSGYYAFGPTVQTIAIMFNLGEGTDGSATNYIGNNVNAAGISDGVGDIYCFDCFSITSVVSDLTQAPTTPLAASVIGGWSSAIRFITDHPTAQQQVDALIACSGDPTCNYDAAAKAAQANTLKGLGYVHDAAIASEDLVNETGVNPFDPADVFTFLLTNGRSLIDEGAALLDLIHHHDDASDRQVSLTGVSGLGYDIADSGFQGSYYDVVADLQMSDEEINRLMVGDSFLTHMDLGGGKVAYGDATFMTLIDPPGLGTAQVRFRGFIQTVPEPGTWSLMILGFGLLGARLRARPDDHHVSNGSGRV